MCAVIGIIGSPEAAKEAFMGLLTLQHRGQDAAGILVSDMAPPSSSSKENSFHLRKNIGLVHRVFNEEIIEKMEGSAALGHSRYSTVSQSEDESNIQPLLSSFSSELPFRVGMVFNGNIINYKKLAARLEKEEGLSFSTNSDLEVIEKIFTRSLSQVYRERKALDVEAVEKAFLSVEKSVVGGYAVAIMIPGKALIAFRDRDGIRPLSLGIKEVDGKKAYCISSETCAFSIIGYTFFRDVQAGELIYIDSEGDLHSRILKPIKKFRPCMFEWVYFAGAESVLSNRGVYDARLRLGKELSKLVKKSIERGDISPDIVVPVPDTARTAAISIAEELNIPYREALIKNRYVQRSFILASQSKREQAVNLKLSLVKTEVFGKKILLVDDSIVRGTTSSRLVKIMRDMGAKEVYFVSTCPPIRHPCYYGIDFPDPEELLATGRTWEEIEKKIGVDKVIYLDQDSLKDAIRMESPCMACLDGDYPTDMSSSKEFLSAREKERQEGG